MVRFDNVELVELAGDKGNDNVTDINSFEEGQSVIAGGDTKRPAPYSRFTRRDKLLLVVQCAAIGFFSTVASSIYYPVLGVIEKEFNVTEEKVNLTVVAYFIFQGVAPTLMGNLADSLGRRPVILISVSVYFAACVGIACCNTYAQLFVLRCLQAAGIAPVVAINSGVMGDVATRAERGGYVGYVAGFQMIGSAFGALIGAGLSSRWGWRAVFWFLAIGSGTSILASLVLLPETKRTIVGNGSIRPKSFVNRSPVLALPALRRRLHLDNPDLETMELTRKINILAPYKILLTPEIDILLFVAGMQFATYTTSQTALSINLSKKYHLSVTQIGLCFLPAGITTLMSVVFAGRFLNWNYVRHRARHEEWLKEQETILMKEYNHDPEEVKEIFRTNSFYSFNIFRARLQLAFFTLVLSSAGFTAFGWCIQVKAPLAAVLVTSAFASLFSNGILTMSSTLIVDLFPSKASAASALVNLFRCSLAVICVACLDKMAAQMNFGGVFTFLSVLTAGSSLLLLIPVRKGKALSHRRREEERRLLEDVATKD